MMLTLRWAYYAFAKGGLKEAGPRAASRSFLRSCLQWLLQHRVEFYISIEIVDKWACRWPRPASTPDGEKHVRIACEWCAQLVRALRCRATSRRLEGIEGLEEGIAQGAQHGFALLERAGLCGGLRWCVGRSGFGGPGVVGDFPRVREVLGQCGEKAVSVGNFTFKWIDWEDSKNICDLADKMLVQYCASGKELASVHHEVGLPTDKGTISGLPLQITLLVLPTGHASVCCPQVSTANLHPTSLYHPLSVMGNTSIQKHHPVLSGV
jgi:hypothetical protein